MLISETDVSSERLNLNLGIQNEITCRAQIIGCILRQLYVYISPSQASHPQLPHHPRGEQLAHVAYSQLQNIVVYSIIVHALDVVLSRNLHACKVRGHLNANQTSHLNCSTVHPLPISNQPYVQKENDNTTTTTESDSISHISFHLAIQWTKCRVTPATQPTSKLFRWWCVTRDSRSFTLSSKNYPACTIYSSFQA